MLPLVCYLKHITLGNISKLAKLATKVRIFWKPTKYFEDKKGKFNKRCIYIVRVDFTEREKIIKPSKKNYQKNTYIKKSLYLCNIMIKLHIRKIFELNDQIKEGI